MALTGRLVALAALGVLLAPIGTAALLGWLPILVLLTLVDLAWAAPITALHFAREPTPALRLGLSGESTLLVSNTGTRRWRGRIRDAWVPSAGASPREQPVTLGPGESRHLTTGLRPTRRGERSAAYLSVRSYGPLGLAGRQRRLVVGGSVRVLPAFASRKFLPEKLARLRQIDGAVLLRHRGQGSEFDSLREYVAGDDIRAIDWRASARAPDVMVRTWRPERDRHIVLAVDTGRTSAARIGDEPRLDAALDACLLLGALAARAGDRVAVIAADVVVRARLGMLSGGEVLPKHVLALAALEPALIESDPQLLAGEVGQLVSKRSLVVVFSALDAASADSGLLPSVRRLAARHQVMVASVRDPRLTQLAARRADSAEVYTAAAAELALAERGLVTEQLNRLGAQVVDASAEVFASKVADAYLDLKAAGRL
ncbi:MAG: lipoprotein [Frankiales bacterium]|nr:lipoprotein [Frankiales bacterium]